MSLFRKKVYVETDRLRTAEATTNMVVGFFEQAVEDLAFAEALAAAEAAEVQVSIEVLRARQVDANAQADRAARVSEKLNALIA